MRLETTVVDFVGAPTKARDKVSTGSESATSALTAEADGVEWPANVLRLTCACARARRATKKRCKSIRLGPAGPSTCQVETLVVEAPR